MNLDKAPYIGQAALRREAKAGPARQLVGLDVSWDDVERLYDEAGLAPQLPATASRVSVPVYRDGIAGGEGHEHHLVAHPQEADRPRHRRLGGGRAWARSSRWRSRSTTSGSGRG